MPLIEACRCAAPFRSLTFQMSNDYAKRSRTWVFTINNYTTCDIDLLETHFLIDAVRYLVFGKESGAEGTPHLQGYVEYENQRTHKQVNKLIPGAYVAYRRGTAAQAAEYCKKDGDFVEFGTISDSDTDKNGKAKAAYGEIVKHAEAGDLSWVKENYPKVYLQWKPRLEDISIPNTAIIEGELQNEWWVGATGTGKSKALWERYPVHFQKELNKWWCGYRGEEIVAIEEWSPKNECTGSQLKIWADRYPFTGQIKGGSLKKLRPQKIIVLSNYTIEECFPAKEDHLPLKRRFKVTNFMSFSCQ